MIGRMVAPHRLLLFAAAFLLPRVVLAAEAPGQHFELSPDRLAPPHATLAVDDHSLRVPRPANAALVLPAGFVSNLFAEGLSHARWLAVAANGDVFLAESSAGKITLLCDANGDGKA